MALGVADAVGAPRTKAKCRPRTEAPAHGHVRRDALPRREVRAGRVVLRLSQHVRHASRRTAARTARNTGAHPHHVPQNTADFGNTESPESASRRRFLALQCALHTATLAAQWWAEPSFITSKARALLKTGPRAPTACSRVVITAAGTRGSVKGCVLLPHTSV